MVGYGSLPTVEGMAPAHPRKRAALLFAGIAALAAVAIVGCVFLVSQVWPFSCCCPSGARLLHRMLVGTESMSKDGFGDQMGMYHWDCTDMCCSGAQCDLLGGAGCLCAVGGGF
jgi:hypothetical protein